jgi:hypothetical protein
MDTNPSFQGDMACRSIIDISEDRAKLMRDLLRSGFCDIEGVRWMVWSDWVRREGRNRDGDPRKIDPAACPWSYEEQRLCGTE